MAIRKSESSCDSCKNKVGSCLYLSNKIERDWLAVRVWVKLLPYNVQQRVSRRNESEMTVRSATVCLETAGRGMLMMSWGVPGYCSTTTSIMSFPFGESVL